HQAPRGRAQERSLLPRAPAVEAGHPTAPQDGRARRAAGAGDVGSELRDREVPARQAGRHEKVPAVEAMASTQSFVVTEAFAGMRLDRFLQRMIPRMSRSS